MIVGIDLEEMIDYDKEHGGASEEYGQRVKLTVADHVGDELGNGLLEAWGETTTTLLSEELISMQRIDRGSIGPNHTGLEGFGEAASQ